MNAKIKKPFIYCGEGVLVVMMFLASLDITSSLGFSRSESFFISVLVLILTLTVVFRRFWISR